MRTNESATEYDQEHEQFLVGTAHAFDRTW